MTLIRFVRAARLKKMVDFTEDKICLTEKYLIELKAITDDCVPLEIHYQDLHQTMLSSEVSLSRESISILETGAASEPLKAFELPLATEFLKKSMQTTFPDHRQKYMKVIGAFFVRLRTIYGKDIRRYQPG